MSLNCGIVGLPNVGKSTIFSALTAAPADAANYPFCTIDPNIGIVSVPDARLDRIADMIPADKVIPAVVEFVDIAGLVKGASKGEGLGNKFLANIREVGMIVHVVRCFENEDIVHVENRINPTDDIEVINIELALADLSSIENRISKNERFTRGSDKSAREKAMALKPLLERLQTQLGEGLPARGMDMSDDERILAQELQLITMKKQIYLCNVDEESIGKESDFVVQVRKIADQEKTDMVVICGKLEADIAALDDPEERAVFLEEAGLEESGLSRLIKTTYKALGLRTFFTVGGVENKAWTFREGMRAPQTAGVIHTDFEKGFIKADVYNCEDLFSAGSESAIKAAGKMRMEGKEYLVKDGDVMFFKFNV
ncbi:redox-regulated ATPase YchF [Oceanispirochaeta sp.]|jgi:GTP-binding protein YchF|uniref:redox-regulated ATPase YchF n=1 Tax=Oceanispirochaeta sp. TaxID=2035350 RepID=UPI00262D36C3|nr:redox-regulated ATPase YchF [Oceanispirochaeta sp.]MDA3957289.1 redox-regulated ATPase YchF [Oceanispirochaeta sp.]